MDFHLEKRCYACIEVNCIFTFHTLFVPKANVEDYGAAMALLLHERGVPWHLAPRVNGASVILFFNYERGKTDECRHKTMFLRYLYDACV